MRTLTRKHDGASEFRSFDLRWSLSREGLRLQLDFDRVAKDRFGPDLQLNISLQSNFVTSLRIVADTLDPNQSSVDQSGGYERSSHRGCKLFLRISARNSCRLDKVLSEQLHRTICNYSARSGPMQSATFEIAEPPLKGPISLHRTLINILYVRVLFVSHA